TAVRAALFGVTATEGTDQRVPGCLASWVRESRVPLGVPVFSRAFRPVPWGRGGRGLRLRRARALDDVDRVRAGLPAAPAAGLAEARGSDQGTCVLPELAAGSG